MPAVVLRKTKSTSFSHCLGKNETPRPRLARDASKTGGRDGTEYDDDKWNARSYLAHHVQRIASDIVMHVQRISSDIVIATVDQLIAAINFTKRSATGATYSGRPGPRPHASHKLGPRT